ncbi:MAG TPA: DUF3034 family protein, partial [Thermoanaerobaculia bacterium]
GDARLLATGGLTQIEGSAGGGIVPWAVLSGYATEDQNGGTGFLTYVATGDYSLWSGGAAFTFHNRVEISAAEQRLHLGTLAEALKLPGAELRMQVFGAKVKLFGDAVYTTAPQVSVGVQYKRNLDFGIPQLVGAKDKDGVDVYVAATKAFLAAAAGRHVVLNATVRATKANQIGLLGFGSSGHNDYEIVPEASAAFLLNNNVAIGGEYRVKRDKLAFSKEDNWSDFFIAYFPNKNVAMVMAVAQLGTIATLPHQSGLFLSVQASF